MQSGLLEHAERSTAPIVPRGVLTRTGQTVPFDGARIRSAIERAGKATGEFDADEAELLASRRSRCCATASATRRRRSSRSRTWSSRSLISADHFATARAYIVYREQHARLRRDQRDHWSTSSPRSTNTSTAADWRVNANANQGYSLGGLILNIRAR